ncbi:MAG TPA: response regulator [Blastocatellia bacterium]|nr:response regulator [Blastocatellia bacterium]
MTRQAKAVTVLMAEDDADDRMLAEDAWLESSLPGELRFVEDGEQLMEYLRRTGRYGTPSEAPAPSLIILDLNMPRKDGREALKEIKSDPALRRIPVVVLTTSRAEEDINKSYELGVNSFIVKPSRFEALVKVVRCLGEYWLEVVELPREGLGDING